MYECCTKKIFCRTEKAVWSKLRGNKNSLWAACLYSPGGRVDVEGGYSAAGPDENWQHSAGPYTITLQITPAKEYQCTPADWHASQSPDTGRSFQPPRAPFSQRHLSEWIEPRRRVPLPVCDVRMRSFPSITAAGPIVAISNKAARAGEGEGIWRGEEGLGGDTSTSCRPRLVYIQSTGEAFNWILPWSPSDQRCQRCGAAAVIRGRRGGIRGGRGPRGGRGRQGRHAANRGGVTRRKPRLIHSITQQGEQLAPPAYPSITQY